MQFFFRNCTHILTKTQGKKFEGMFLVKITSQGTSLKRVDVKGDSLLIHEFTYSLFNSLCSVTSDMSGYSHSYHQSASKHSKRTFLYSPMRELVCNGQLWARAALRQLPSYKVG